MNFSSLFSSYFIYLLCLIGFFCFFIIKSPFRRRDLQMTLIWLAIILMVVIGYSFKKDLFNSRFAAYLLPGHGYVTKEHYISFAKDKNGHFYIIGEVNNHYIRFLVDTGATGILLSLYDAKRIGLDIKRLNFNKVSITANGKMFSASIIIPQVKIKDFVFTDVKASVAATDLLDQSLLGMSFLKNYNFSIQDDILTIYFP